MIGIANCIGVGQKARSGGGVPFESDLRTWHETLTTNTFNESLVPLNAKILPAGAKFNGSNNYLDKSDKYLVGGSAIDITVKIDTGSSTAMRTIFSFGGHAAATAGIVCYIAATTRVLTVSTSNGSTTLVTATFGALATNTYYEIRIQWSGVTGGTMTVTINGTPVTSTNTQSWSGNSEMAFTIGCYRQTSPLGFFSGNIYEYQDADQHYYLTGLGLYEYNTLAATQITWHGDAGHSVYSLNSSLFYFTGGYKIYKKTGQLNEYLPTGAIATTIVAAGYALSDYDTYLGSSTVWNMFPALIDFDPLDGVNALLVNFDRSNVTVASALSRASAYYDAANVYRWHISEIADPRIYTEFLNVGYAGKLYSKITTQLVSSVYYIKSLVSTLNYATDKTGADQLSVMTYCGTDVYAE